VSVVCFAFPVLSCGVSWGISSYCTSYCTSYEACAAGTSQMNDAPQRICCRSKDRDISSPLLARQLPRAFVVYNLLWHWSQRMAPRLPWSPRCTYLTTRHLVASTQERREAARFRLGSVRLWRLEQLGNTSKSQNLPEDPTSLHRSPIPRPGTPSALPSSSGPYDTLHSLGSRLCGDCCDRSSSFALPRERLYSRIRHFKVAHARSLPGR
jgi:hypothetical protein